MYLRPSSGPLVESDNNKYLKEINEDNVSSPRATVTLTETNVENIELSPWAAPLSLSSRMNSALPLNESRPQPAIISLHITDHDEIDDKPPMKNRLPALKLINFNCSDDNNVNS